MRRSQTFLTCLLLLLSLPAIASAQPRRIDADEDETGGGGATSSTASDASADQAPPPQPTPQPPPRATPQVDTGAPPRVYVVSVAADDTLEGYAQRAGAAARHELRSLTSVDWRAADQLFLGYDDSALETIERARVRLDQGRQAYLNLDLQQAIALLSGAVTDFDSSAAALEDPEDVGQALLFLGASYAFNGQAREATRAFARLQVQMPHIVPDPNVFPPDVIQRFDAARPRDAASPAASISIESDPPGAIAYVDFVARGVTPIVVSGLVGGEHIVRVTRAGATPSVTSVTVRARATESTSAFLVDGDRTAGLHEAIASIRDADIAAAPAGTPVHTVAEILDVERIGVIRVANSDVEGQVDIELLVYDVTNGRRLVRGAGTAPVAIGELEAAVHRLVSGALEAALTTRPQATEAEPPPPVDEESPLTPPPPPPEHSVVEEWWFWTILGGAVLIGAAIAVGVVLGTQGSSLGQNPSGVVVLEF